MVIISENRQNLRCTVVLTIVKNCKKRRIYYDLFDNLLILNVFSIFYLHDQVHVHRDINQAMESFAAWLSWVLDGDTESRDNIVFFLENKVHFQVVSSIIKSHPIVVSFTACSLRISLCYHAEKSVNGYQITTCFQQHR